MKRIACLAAAALVVVTSRPAEAQLGIKGGVSYATVSNTGAIPEDLGGRTGVAIGLSAGTSGGLVGFGVEALYAQRGADDSSEVQKLEYIDVPAYLTVTLPLPGLQPFAFAGPQASFEVSCSLRSSDCADGDRASTTYAGVIGAGVRLGETGGLSIEGRYVYGLSDLEFATVTAAESYQHRSFMVLVGLRF